MVEIRRSQTPSGRGPGQRRFSEYKRPTHFSMFSNPAIFPKQRSPFFSTKPSAAPLIEAVSDPVGAVKPKPGHYRKRNRLQSLSGHFHFGYKWRTDTKHRFDDDTVARKRKQSKDDLDTLHSVNSGLPYPDALRNTKSEAPRRRRASKSLEAEDIDGVIEFMTRSPSDSEDETDPFPAIQPMVNPLLSPRRSPSPKSVASPSLVPLVPLAVTRKKRRSLSVGNLRLERPLQRKRSGYRGVLDVPGIGRAKSAHPPDPKLLQNLRVSTDGDVDQLFVRSRSTTRHRMETPPMTSQPLPPPLVDTLCDEEEEDVIEQRGITPNGYFVH